MFLLKMATEVLRQKILKSKQIKTQTNPSKIIKFQGQRENLKIFQGEKKELPKEQKSVGHHILYQWWSTQG